MDKKNESSSSKIVHPHYYGDLIRKHLFFATFVIMIAALLDAELRNFYLFVGLFGVVGFTVLAGFTSRSNRSIMLTDIIVSAVMFLIFEYFAISPWCSMKIWHQHSSWLTIAVVYLVTLYYSTKTLVLQDAEEQAKKSQQ